MKKPPTQAQLDGRARQVAANAAAREALIEEVEFLLGCGESPERTAHRLGYDTPASLERRLLRSGRRDLAKAFRPRQTPEQVEASRRRFDARRVPCRMNCGGTSRHDSKHQVCATCVSRYGLARALGATGSLEAALALSVAGAPSLMEAS